MYLTVSFSSIGSLVQKRKWFWHRWPIQNLPLESANNGEFYVYMPPRAYIRFDHEKVESAKGYRLCGIEVCVFHLFEED